MKTPMEQLRDKLEEQKKSLQEMDLLGVLLENELAHKINQINSIQMIIYKMLLIEKEVILEAFIAGDERGTKDIPFDAGQYYNQTFKKQ